VSGSTPCDKFGPVRVARPVRAFPHCLGKSWLTSTALFFLRNLTPRKSMHYETCWEDWKRPLVAAVARDLFASSETSSCDVCVRRRFPWRVLDARLNASRGVQPTLGAWDMVLCVSRCDALSLASRKLTRGRTGSRSRPFCGLLTWRSNKNPVQLLVYRLQQRLNYIYSTN
jgi:hypothetical protein